MQIFQLNHVRNVKQKGMNVGNQQIIVFGIIQNGKNNGLKKFQKVRVINYGKLQQKEAHKHQFLKLLKNLQNIVKNIVQFADIKASKDEWLKMFGEDIIVAKEKIGNNCVVWM
jgi:hypothetical protein